MSTNYPDLEGFSYTFARAELTVARSKFTAISGVSFDQPTTEGVVMGTRPWPIARTEGQMEMGEGGITFTDLGETVRLLSLLNQQAGGRGYRNAIFQLDWVLKEATSRRPLIKMACLSCRLLGNPIEHEGGEEALGGEVAFSFMRHTINGMSPHGE